MTGRNDDELDDQLRGALGTLQAPDGYFEDLAERTLARLDDVPAELADDVADDAVIDEARDEDSGLRDIVSLASEAVARMRSSSPSVPRAPSVSAAWRVVALPQSPEPVDELAQQRALRVAPPPGSPKPPKTEPVTPAKARRWYAAGGVAVAAAAALVVFVLIEDRAEDRGHVVAEVAMSRAEPVTPVEAAAGSAGEPERAAALPAPIKPVDTPQASLERPKVAATKPSKTGKKAKPLAKGAGSTGSPPAGEDIAPIVQNAPPPTHAPPPTPSEGDEITSAVQAPGESRAPTLARKSLSAADITQAMAAVAPVARRCYVGTTGTALVTATVAPSGQVTRVVVTGELAGTPTAACVDRAVRTARFPPWDGAPQTVKYTYQLAE